jgi:leucyl-tRNA synthetase
MENILESTKPDVFEVPSANQRDRREELIKLADAVEIKYTAKYIKRASEKTLESIYKDYERQQLENTNYQLADVIIIKFSELMQALEAVTDIEGMKKELAENSLLRKYLKNLVGYVTPYIPLIGILSGGITVGKHVVSTKVNCPEKEK